MDGKEDEGSFKLEKAGMVNQAGYVFGVGLWRGDCSC